ncbi:MAG TPA: pyrroline-5-carboxylate reductase [Steroidobacteraceae bacterium]|nr:pyrroline-5-carboxylate reductase [Steroidobacteraceae bacterium]
MTAHRIGFLGGGNMARALIGGLIGHGMPALQLSVGEPLAEARESLAREFKVRVSPDNLDAIEGCGLVIVAVKPQEAGPVLRSLAPAVQKARPVLLSVAAGIPVASLSAWVGPGVAIIRTMPNRPALIGAGVTGMYASPGVTPEQRALAGEVMQAAGAAVWVERESDLDVVTALSGSGPAYFFLLAELMMQAAVGQGLEPEAARRLAVGTLHGAGALAHASDGDLARLRREVTSRGGTTQAALEAFAAADLPAIVARAMQAASRRSRELAAQFGNAAP